MFENDVIFSDEIFPNLSILGSPWGRWPFAAPWRASGAKKTAEQSHQPRDGQGCQTLGVGVGWSCLNVYSYSVGRMIGWLYRIPYSRCSEDIHYQNQKVIFVVKWLVWTRSRSHDSKQMWKRSHSHIEVHIQFSNQKYTYSVSKIHNTFLVGDFEWGLCRLHSKCPILYSPHIVTQYYHLAGTSGILDGMTSNHDSGLTSDGGGLNSFWYINLIYWRWWLFLIFFEDLELIHDSIIHPFVDLQFYTMCLFCFHWLPIAISFIDSFVFSFENRRIMKLLHTIQ